MHADLAERIDALLPQTQCGRCGYPACRPYAEAIVEGEAVNRCPPGGEAGIAALAEIAGRLVAPLDPATGKAGPLERAVIDEAWCIGCALCIQACPVDAIVGAPKHMHAVLASWCTGCGLCVPPCPVDCIAMVGAGRKWSAADADTARARYAARRDRMAKASPTKEAPALGAPLRALSREEREAAAAAALARARARRRAA